WSSADRSSPGVSSAIAPSAAVPASDPAMIISLPRVFHVVAGRLPEDETYQPSLRNRRPQLLPDRHDQVLGRWNHTPQPRHVEVEVAVIEIAQDHLLHH